MNGKIKMNKKDLKLFTDWIRDYNNLWDLKRMKISKNEWMIRQKAPLLKKSILMTITFKESQ